jgi:hypothetical protein
MLWSLQFALDECLVDDHFGGDVRIAMRLASDHFRRAYDTAGRGSNGDR